MLLSWWCPQLGGRCGSVLRCRAHCMLRCVFTNFTHEHQCAVHEYRELKQNSFYVLEAERNPW